MSYVIMVADDNWFLQDSGVELTGGRGLAQATVFNTLAAAEAAHARIHATNKYYWHIRSLEDAQALETIVRL